jgi:gluconate 5-dehydrogenase
MEIWIFVHQRFKIMMELFNLTGKNAMITGGTHGLGMAMAEALAEAGAQLIITGTTPSKMEEALAHYHAKGYKQKVIFLM